MASQRQIVGSLDVLYHCISDDIIKCFVDRCLTDPFYHLTSANRDDKAGDNDEEASVILQCEAVLSGLSKVAQLPCDSLSDTVRTLTRAVLLNIYQLLPTPYQVCLLK